MRKYTILLAILLTMLISAAVFSQALPHSINYQGVLKDASGVVVINGDYNLTFKLYDVGTDGSPLWTETKSITVTDGIISTQLGSIEPIVLPFDKSYWLGIAVDTETELTPRIKLSTVPYSYMSMNVMNESITADKITSGQVVKSLNTLKDDINLVAGGNVTITPSGNNLTISATGGTAGDNWGTQTVISNTGYFTGNGTTTSPLSLSSMGSSAGQVLKWNGTEWDNAADDNGPWSETTDYISYYGTKNVGIGINTPARKLTLADGGTSCYALIQNLSTGFTVTDGLLIGMQGLNGWLSSHESGNLYLGTGNTARIIIDASGHVGIGTTLPTYRLDVAGSININKGITSGIALRCNGAEALWYNGTYFSWGYSGVYNFFGNKLRIGGNGNLEPAYTLYVDGTAAKSSSGTAWIVSSDIRLKDILGNYERGLDDIIELQPVLFKYKEINPRSLPSQTEEIGFVAQDVQKVFPEAVTEAEDGYLDFNIHPINVALVNAVKELKEENEKLKEINGQLINRLEKIEKYLNTMSMK